ncbi:hypothetical protein [Micromonospora sp. CPCC 205539]|uniref:hypothetical protein n=1 Tax=Micromonospora sp. CPCC 205539 TaxID=3122408 RepID=UPI002FF0245A
MPPPRATDLRNLRSQHHRPCRGTRPPWSGYVDADGFFWTPDQALGSRPWGYVGGRTPATKANIAGTEDDALVRTQQTGQTFSYVF